MLVFVALVALAPNHAWASDDDLAYMYLDLDENGENTVLVILADQRTEAEQDDARCAYLGPWVGDGFLLQDEEDEAIRYTVRRVVFDDSKGRICPSTCEDLFYDFISLVSVDASGLDTSKVSSMYRMFGGCSSLTSLDLSGLDTSCVTNAGSMFRGCSSLTSLNLSTVDMSKVDNMFGMFFGCSSLQSLDISTFDTSNMVVAFYECDSLVRIVLNPKFACGEDSYFPIGETGVWSPEGHEDVRIETREDLAAYLSSEANPVGFVRVDIGLDTWTECGSCLWKVSAGELVVKPEIGDSGTLEQWDDPPWLEYADMITSVRFEGTIEALTCKGMFSGCSALESLDLSGLDTSSATDMGTMFSQCSSLQSLDPSGLKTPNVTYMGGMFMGCSALRSLDLSGFDTSNVTDMSAMFALCESLQSLDLSNFSTSAVTSMPAMFYDCESLVDLDLSGFDTSSVTDMNSMLLSVFIRTLRIGSKCCLRGDESGLEGYWQSVADGTIYDAKDIPGNADVVYRRLTLGSSAVTYASLDNAGTLTLSTDVPFGFAQSYIISDLGYESAEEVPWNDQRDRIRKVRVEASGNLESFDHWFCGCENLEEADLSGMDVSCVKSAAEAFSGCSRLSAVTRPSSTGASLKDCSQMFRGCSSLKTLDLSWLGTRRAKSMRRMFHGCRSLVSVTLGADFTFRGMGVGRLPGSEFPDGAWAAEADSKTAYDSASIPSFTAATYVRVPDEDLKDLGKGVTLVSSRGEDDQGKPQLQVESTIKEVEGGAEEHLEYTVADDYAGDNLYIGESPRAQALKFSSGKVKWNTVVSKVYASNRNYWTTSATIGRRVKAIEPYAFESAPNIQTLYVKSPKLKKYSKVALSLANSNVSWVWVSGMSSSNVRKVVNAFNSWAWMG